MQYAHGFRKAVSTGNSPVLASYKESTKRRSPVPLYPEKVPTGRCPSNRHFKISRRSFFMYTPVIVQTDAFEQSPKISVHTQAPQRISQIPTAPWIPWTEVHWFPKSHALGASSLWCRSWELRWLMWYKLFTPWGGAPDPQSPALLCVAAPGVVFLARLHLCLSSLSWCGPFVLCCGGNGWSSFQFFLSGNYSICTCRLGVSMAGK